MSAQISKGPKAIYKSCPFCGAIGPTDTRREKAEALWNGAALVALRLPNGRVTS